MLIYIVFYIFFAIVSVNAVQRERERDRAKCNPISLLAATDGYIKTAFPLT